MTKKFPPYSSAYDYTTEGEETKESPDQDPSSNWDKYYDSRKYSPPSMLSLEFLKESEFPDTEQGIKLLRGVIVQSHALSTIVALMYRDRGKQGDANYLSRSYPDELTQSVSPHIRKEAMAASKKYLTDARYADNHLHEYINTLPPNKAWPFFVAEAVYTESEVGASGRLANPVAGERAFLQPKSVHIFNADDEEKGGKWTTLKQRVVTRMSDEIENLRDVQARLISCHGLYLPHTLNPGLIEAAFDDTLYRGVEVVRLRVSDWLPKAVNMAIDRGIAESSNRSDGGTIDDYCSGFHFKH